MVREPNALSIVHIYNNCVLIYSAAPTRRLQSYTQYIPLSVNEVKFWAGTPTIFVLDCSAAGILMNHFVQPSAQQEDIDRGLDPDTPPEDGGRMRLGGAGAAPSASHGDTSEWPCMIDMQ